MKEFMPRLAEIATKVGQKFTDSTNNAQRISRGATIVAALHGAPSANLHGQWVSEHGQPAMYYTDGKFTQPYYRKHPVSQTYWVQFASPKAETVRFKSDVPCTLEDLAHTDKQGRANVLVRKTDHNPTITLSKTIFATYSVPDGHGGSASIVTGPEFPFSLHCYPSSEHPSNGVKMIPVKEK